MKYLLIFIALVLGFVGCDLNPVDSMVDTKTCYSYDVTFKVPKAGDTTKVKMIVDTTAYDCTDYSQLIPFYPTPNSN